MPRHDDHFNRLVELYQRRVDLLDDLDQLVVDIYNELDNLDERRDASGGVDNDPDDTHADEWGIASRRWVDADELDELQHDYGADTDNFKRPGSPVHNGDVIDDDPRDRFGYEALGG